MTTAFCPTPAQQLTACRRVDDTCQIECFHHLPVVVG